MRLAKPSLLLAAAAVTCLTVAAPASATTFTAKDDPGARPAGCTAHFRDPNIRVRTIVSGGADMHNMSDKCVPYGPYMGHLDGGSEFHVYYADPYDSNWCYGWSKQINQRGYILCSDYN